jgi:hypothetical protein
VSTATRDERGTAARERGTTTGGRKMLVTVRFEVEYNPKYNEEFVRANAFSTLYEALTQYGKSATPHEGIVDMRIHKEGA